MPEGSFQPQQPSGGIQPPNQDIYGQGERPEPIRRRRRRWFSRKSAFVEKPSPAAAVSVGVGPRVETPVRHEERRRRRRSHSHSPELDLINRITWIAVLVVTLLYLGLLAAVVLWQRTHPKIEKVETPAAMPAEKPDPLPTSVNEPTRPVSELIAVWKHSLQALDNLHKHKTKQPPAEAAAALEEILAESPGFTQARLELALALEEQNNHTAARDHLLDVLDHDPASLVGQQALGRVYLALNQPDEALALARWMVDNDPYSTPAHELAAEALLKQNVTEDAIVHLKKLASLNRDNLTFQNNLGTAYIKIGDYRSALQTFREVLRMDEGNSVAHFNMALAYARQNQASNTVDILVQAARRFGHPFVTTWTRGEEFDAVRNDPAFVQFIGHPEAISAEPASTNAP